MERFLSEAEFAALGSALVDAEARGENAFAIAAIRLLALTGCRKSEILSLQWTFVDWDRGLLRLPDSKTGAKVVVLSEDALGVLRATPRTASSRYVFPASSGNGHLVGLQKIWAKVRSDAGLGEVRLHDLRHSFASLGVAQGESLYVVGQILGHSRSTSTARYAHLADSSKRAATNRVSGAVANALKGEHKG